MSFFIKNKQSRRGAKNKFSNKKEHKGKSKRPKLETRDDEITSSEDEQDPEEPVENHVKDLSSEDENETAQEKKLRLAKIYLEEIEKEELARLEDKEFDSEQVNGALISERLKIDYLKQTGRLKASVAHEYIGADTDNLKILKAKEHKSAITCICVSSNGNYLFSGSKNGSIVKWSLLEYKKVGSIPYKKKSDSKEVLGHSKEILSIALSADDNFLAVGDGTNIIQVWDPTNLKHKGSLTGHRDSVTGLTFRRGTHTLYSCSKDRSIKVWTLDEMSYVETLYGHQDKITSIDSLSKERAITSGGRDTSIRIWKIVEESQLIYNGHSGSIDIVRLINEEHFVSGGDDGYLCVWSVSKKKPLCMVKEAHGCDTTNSQPNWITSVASLVNTDLIASGSHDGFIRIWKLESNFRKISLLFSIEIEGFVNDLVFTLDGKYLLAGIGREHRFGRWTVINSAKDTVVIIPLIKK
ncbi:hypothetical protein RN001_016042 [Aquatica leii]|uniref:U3 small nucleolar RNA-interacting protein 2 n=1 Tax=Aquatica leii TaxID=1421715 RepID=A0AAN7SK84_9COLE|nr:hypothetical protein RN001_016042 [Aquatica leii]